MINSNNFNDETETAVYDWLKSFLAEERGLCVRHAKYPSLARAQRMNRKNV